MSGIELIGKAMGKGSLKRWMRGLPLAGREGISISTFRVTRQNGDNLGLNLGQIIVGRGHVNLLNLIST
jgi:hypothetical protein